MEVEKGYYVLVKDRNDTSAGSPDADWRFEFRSTVKHPSYMSYEEAIEARRKARKVGRIHYQLMKLTLIEDE